MPRVGRWLVRAPTICSVHGCPELAVRLNRCRQHAAERDARQKRTTPTKIHEPRDRKRRAQAVRKWRNQYGNYCPGYKRAPHDAADLTAEHVNPVAEGGAWDGDLVVLCRSCNSRHGAETRNRLGR